MDTTNVIDKSNYAVYDENGVIIERILAVKVSDGMWYITFNLDTSREMCGPFQYFLEVHREIKKQRPNAHLLCTMEW